jgi:hypothetical protein
MSMRSHRKIPLAALLVPLALAAVPAAAQQTLENAEEGMSLTIPEGWESIPETEIPAAERKGLVFAVRRLDEGATFVVKNTGREARPGEGKRYADMLKRRGGVAADSRVVIGGAEGWRIVRLAEESGQPLLRSTVFLPHGGKLYMLTGNKVGSSNPAEASFFDVVESAVTLIQTAGPSDLPTVPVELPEGMSASLPEGWRSLSRGQIGQLLPESFGEVEAAFFSPREDYLFYVSHVGETGIISSVENLSEIGDQFEEQLSAVPAARVIARVDEEIAGRPAHRIVYEIVNSPENRLYEARLLTTREGQLILVGGLALAGADSSALQIFDPIFATVAMGQAAYAEQPAEADLAATARGIVPKDSYPAGRGILPRAFPPDHYEQGE